MTTLTKNHAELTEQVAAHIAAGAVIQGTYWNGSEGCFIGCLAHSSDATVLEEKYGLPLPLVRICESIFERLPAADAKAFFGALPIAVGRDGKDLSRVHWRFLAAELRALPKVPENIQVVIGPVIAGMDRMANGDDWPAAAAASRADARADLSHHAKAARAAAYAAAYAAYSAAHSAAYVADAAAYVARAADAADAATSRQRDTILRLIAEA